MRKKATILLVILALALSLLSLSAGAAAEGTKVSTADEFKTMTPGGSYYLTNDIDLGGEEFECFIFAEFNGTIDGNGYSVFNYKLSNNGKNANVGTVQMANRDGDLIIKDLSFGKEGNPVLINIDNGAVNKHHGVICGQQFDNAYSVMLTNVKVYADFKVLMGEKCNVGGYIGYSRMFAITNCEMHGIIEVGSGPDIADGLYHNAGGFIGSANKDMSTLSNCANYADVITYCSRTDARAGGFVCYSGKTTILENCINYGDISCYDTATEKSDSQAGGFIAHANNAAVTLTGCINYGKVTGTSRVGGFIARVAKGAFIEACINEGEYSKDAEHFGPFAALVEPASFAEIDAFCIDRTDPDFTPVTTPEKTTPVVTSPDVTTPDITTPTVTNPPGDNDNATAEPEGDYTAPPDIKKGCGSSLALSSIFVIAGAAACVTVRKKKDR